MEGKDPVCLPGRVEQVQESPCRLFPAMLEHPYHLLHPVPERRVSSTGIRDFRGQMIDTGPGPDASGWRLAALPGPGL
jgi:hypothetical protein